MRTEIDRLAELSYAKNKGKAEGKAEAASAMLADGMSPALVSKYTGLSEEQIAALQ